MYRGEEEGAAYGDKPYTQHPYPVQQQQPGMMYPGAEYGQPQGKAEDRRILPLLSYCSV